MIDANYVEKLKESILGIQDQIIGDVSEKIYSQAACFLHNIGIESTTDNIFWFKNLHEIRVERSSDNCGKIKFTISFIPKTNIQEEIDKKKLEYITNDEYQFKIMGPEYFK